MPIADPQSVALLASTFFDRHGNRMLCGGAERYLIELAGVIRQAYGRSVALYQDASEDWSREYAGIPVIGLASEGDMRRLAERFRKATDQAPLAIYNTFHLAAHDPHPASIVISHGVYWDQPTYQNDQGANSATGPILAAIRHTARTISVDTNTLNWVRTVDSAAAGKMRYIPNFVDLEQYRPTDRQRNHLTVLYPRRLYKPRGFYAFKNVSARLLTKYPDLVVYFAGQAEQKEELHVVELQRQFKDRVRWQTFEPDQMFRAYEEADIVVIPTLCSEGTSLSCLEAMAAGKIVIATDVGGLPNLIVDSYNGLLIHPSEEALERALSRILSAPEDFQELARNARSMAERSFSLARWQARWTEELEEFLGPRDRQAELHSVLHSPVTEPTEPLMADDQTDQDLVASLLSYRSQLELENDHIRESLNRYYGSLVHLEQVHGGLQALHTQLQKDSDDMRAVLGHPLVRPAVKAYHAIGKLRHWLTSQRGPGSPS